MYLRKNTKKNVKTKIYKISISGRDFIRLLSLFSIINANYVFIRMILNNYVAYISLKLCFYQNDFKQLCYVHLIEIVFLSE